MGKNRNSFYDSDRFAVMFGSLVFLCDRSDRPGEHILIQLAPVVLGKNDRLGDSFPCLAEVGKQAPQAIDGDARANRITEDERLHAAICTPATPEV